MSTVVPIRDLWRQTNALIERVYHTMGCIPADGLEPGFHLSSDTQVELRRAIELLKETHHILRRVQGA